MLEFSGPVWRILFLSQINAPLAPSKAPEGRFHYSGQTALYASRSAEGAAVAIRRYVSACDPPRVIQKARISGARLADLRSHTKASIIWQGIRDTCGSSPTWQFSDRARNHGADGLIYSSRSRPDLSHIVLFNISPALIRLENPATAWEPPYTEP
ncbi:RES family NAD+ phosphorylase [Ruegeria halocynthiae]|uniref:RES family NAD+ phosphorylase n=1 Tax=Ruegeria halocynthiae TaxID=985054 RepID=UPI00068A1B21|nr:RES family NAD+ phosphorylase [Ruegeria halocynthiae]